MELFDAGRVKFLNFLYDNINIRGQSLIKPFYFNTVGAHKSIDG
jgi:hypothetical protein